jgi:hypothetical protein
VGALPLKREFPTKFTPERKAAITAGMRRMKQERQRALEARLGISTSG